DPQPSGDDPPPSSRDGTVGAAATDVARELWSGCFAAPATGPGDPGDASPLTSHPTAAGDGTENAAPRADRLAPPGLPPPPAAGGPPPAAGRGPRRPARPLRPGAVLQPRRPGAALLAGRRPHRPPGRRGPRVRPRPGRPPPRHQALQPPAGPPRHRLGRRFGP